MEISYTKNRVIKKKSDRLKNIPHIKFPKLFSNFYYRFSKMAQPFFAGVVQW